MKRAVVLAVVIAAAFAAHRYYDGAWSPERQYEAFAERVLHRDYAGAEKLADGLTADDLAKSGTQEQIGGGPPMFQTLFPSLFTIESRSREGNTVTIRAVQTVLFNPVGVESALRPAMLAKMNQVVKLEKHGGGWKIVEFENTFDSMDSAPKR